MYIFRILSLWQWRWQCQQTLSADEIYSSSYVIPPVWLWRETKFKSLEEFYFGYSWLIFSILLLILSLLQIVFTSSLHEYTNNLRFRSCQVSHICNENARPERKSMIIQSGLLHDKNRGIPSTDPSCTEPRSSSMNKRLILKTGIQFWFKKFC